MDVVSIENFMAQRGADRGAIGDAGAHKRGRNQSNKQWNRICNAIDRRSAFVVERQHELRGEYAALVAEGHIRPPTRLERLQRIAAGHDDNDSVHAARRLLAAQAQRTEVAE